MIRSINKLIKKSAVVLFAILLTICVVRAQTATFTKQLTVNINNRLELTDAMNQPLIKGGMYRVKLSVLVTGTKAGAEYLVWYDGDRNIWATRRVSASGMSSNHPTLVVEDSVVKVATMHQNNYRIRAFVEYFATDNVAARPIFFGSSFHWQRYINHLYYLDGNVGIGTETASEKLEVNGTIRAKEIKVEATPWPDYVFEEDYQLPSLKDTEKFIKANKHLPDVPSAKEVEGSGVALGKMNAILLKKVEELTLHLIEKDKQFEEQAKQINQLKIVVEQLQNSVAK